MNEAESITLYIYTFKIEIPLTQHDISNIITSIDLKFDLDHLQNNLNNFWHVQSAKFIIFY